MREWPYTASSRDVLWCLSPTTKRFPEALEMSQGQSPRAEGNLEVEGDVQPNSSRFEAVYSHSLIINPSLGMYQEIHPFRASSIDSVKINTSLPMMREWTILLRLTSWLQCQKSCKFLSFSSFWMFWDVFHIYLPGVEAAIVFFPAHLQHYVVLFCFMPMRYGQHPSNHPVLHNWTRKLAWYLLCKYPNQNFVIGA